MPMEHSFSVESRIPETIKRLERRSLGNLLEAATIWHKGIVNEQLTGGRSGRQYTIPGTRKKYTASAPGQAPASRTGTLRSGYRFRVKDRGWLSTGEVGSPEIYALWLEKGTSGMAPRPHVEPAFQAKRNEILKSLDKRWDR